MKRIFLLSFFLIGLSACPDQRSNSSSLAHQDKQVIDHPSDSKESLFKPICGIEPITKSDIEALKDPYIREIAQVFVQQVNILEHEKSEFGNKFVAVAPESNPLYASSRPKKDDSHSRWIIRLKRPISLSHDLYAGLYRSEQPGIISNWWDIHKMRRESGVVFAGYKIPPEKLSKQCGLWSPIFSQSKSSNNRRFQELDEGFHPKLVFNLKHCTNWTPDSGFVSTTRSIHIARHFAIDTGSMGLPADEGYVYAIYVKNGFDLSDSSAMEKSAMVWQDEQEITVPGVLPWVDFVAYRKLKRHPIKGAPPEFVGPIYVRSNFEHLEPEAFKQIVHEFSIKSWLTQKFEKGEKWNKNWDQQEFSESHSESE
jgi:hypothetical protein